MKIAVVRRGDRWLAQVVHIGNELHWVVHRRIQHEVSRWVSENCTDYLIDGWQFFFKNEQDLTLFLLRWDGYNEGS